MLTLAQRFVAKRGDSTLVQLQQRQLNHLAEKREAFVLPACDGRHPKLLQLLRDDCVDLGE